VTVAGAKQHDLFHPDIQVVGTIDRVTYHNEETGYTVARLLPEDADIANEEGDGEHIYAVGSLIEPVAGECYSFRGKWIDDPKYGRQFKFVHACVHVPTTKDGLVRFLGSGMIKGLGPKTAQRIVDTFGDKTVEILDTAPSRLREIPGLGRKTLSRIIESWTAKRHIQETMTFLQGFGLTPRLAEKIYRRYGDRTIEVVQENPYRLARDIERVGFKKADAIAMRMGMAPDSPERAEAASLYLLAQASQSGHCFLTMEEMIAQGCELMGCAESVIVNAVQTLHKELYVSFEKIRDALGNEKNAVYLINLREDESAVAKMIRQLAAAPKLLPQIDFDKSIEDFRRRFNFQFAPQQRAAIEAALGGGVSVITGGPGTGKTTIVRAILKILQESGGHALLAAPTGRAARRLAESSKSHAKTIHRLLNFDPSTGGFLHGPGLPLKGDLIVVDEASMLDIQLASSLLSAIPSTAGVLFVGDVDQLPSVGPGEFLRDVIESGVAKVVRLDEVFRQKRSSLIVRNAHRVNQGQFPYLNLGDLKKADAEEGIAPEDAADEAAPEAAAVIIKNGDQAASKNKKPQDFFFIEREHPEELREALAKVVCERIPQSFGFNPMDDVQVLTPMRRNSLGAIALNEMLQARLNAANEPEYIRTGIELRLGDKLMQTRNNYELDVFNGDIGRVREIDREKKTVRIDFEGRVKTYAFDDLDQLELAYAISIHKSQGSEYKAAVVLLHSQHYVMLQRNLIYTALTRARELAILLGTRKALGVALKNVATRERNTALAWRLRTGEEAYRLDDEG
jgi:exodeoxyribonuclease V alpha subunit